MPLVRTMTTADLPAVLGLQAQCYDDRFHESQSVLAAKLALSPQTCWVVESESGLQGYLFAHPWQSLTPPSWNAVLDVLPAAPDCFYLHDLAVNPNSRGKGIGEALIQAARKQAAYWNLANAALTAVQGSSPFWARHGFKVVLHESGQHDEHLMTYGADAAFMTADWSVHKA